MLNEITVKVLVGGAFCSETLFPTDMMLTPFEMVHCILETKVTVGLT